jgi:hypothetical protein
VLIRTFLLLASFFVAGSASAVPVPRPTPFPQKAESPARESTAAEVPLPQPAPPEVKPSAKPEPPPAAPADKSEKTEAEPPTAAPNAPPPTPPAEEQTVETSDPVCDALKASGEVEFKALPAITENRCGAPFPISITAVQPKGGTRVELEQAVVARCAVGAAMVAWLRDAVQPAARKYMGEEVTKLGSTNGYACRGRNRRTDTKLSEHGRANAIDVGTFKFKSGKIVAVGHKEDPGLSFLLDVRAKACGPFTTVLGPGSDVYHSTHLHLDTIKRGNNGTTTYCH